MIRAQAENLLRGTLPNLSWAREGSRLPAAACGKLTADTVRAARIPAGLHLAFTGRASVVELTVTVGEPTTVPAPTVPDALVVTVPGEAPRHVAVPTGGGTVRVELPEREPENTVRVYLPEAVQAAFSGVAADHPLEPAPRGPRWVVYGDSITQGWSVTTPGLAWPSRVADALGLDLVNLGFAGSARGELPTADVVAASQARAVTLAWGTNAHTSLPTSAAQIAETTRLYLTTVRAGLPEVPITVVSPIVRPDAEGARNRFGATLVDLREAMESAVRGFAADGDDRVVLVPGRYLVPAAQLVDGIHPGDEGHRTLADGVAPHVRVALRQFGQPAGAGGR